MVAEWLADHDPKRSCASGMSRHPDPAVAVAEAVGWVLEDLEHRPTIAIVFVSGRMAAAFEPIITAANTLLSPSILLGVTSSGVLAGGEEAESGDAIAIWAGTIDGVRSFHLDTVPGHEPRVVGLPPDLADGSTLLVLADPFSLPVEALIDQMKSQCPLVALAGGLASLGPGRNRLAASRPSASAGLLEFRSEGAVGVVFPPGSVVPVVSQGCRPIGQPWTVTAADGQVIGELGGRPALDRVNEMIADLDARDRLCASQGLHLGLVANPRATEFDRGDFLIRSVLGADRETGDVVVGVTVHPGDAIQFQVRDAASAHDDLAALLSSVVDVPPMGALIFTCTGRGSHLFAEPSHDAALVSEFTDGRGVAGMFCAGELGPVGRGENAARVNVLHAFTATVLLFPATVQASS
ncbi:MAG: FIST C-terminal domain-containing protein [Actinomycetota bacterium]|nr:FIST C-terminal domain-containing protein [Actinomycetota bacterium]